MEIPPPPLPLVAWSSRRWSPPAACKARLSSRPPPPHHRHTYNVDCGRDEHPEAVSLPELFKHRGFLTCGFGKTFHDDRILSPPGETPKEHVFRHWHVLGAYAGGGGEEDVPCGCLISVPGHSPRPALSFMPPSLPDTCRLRHASLVERGVPALRAAAGLLRAGQARLVRQDDEPPL